MSPSVITKIARTCQSSKEKGSKTCSFEDPEGTGGGGRESVGLRQQRGLLQKDDRQKDRAILAPRKKRAHAVLVPQIREPEDSEKVQN